MCLRLRVNAKVSSDDPEIETDLDAVLEILTRNQCINLNLPVESLQGLVPNQGNGSGGGTRTPDTRIMIPLL